MGKGAPDWSNVRKGVSVFRLDDMAELAARLGSIVTFDRRGDVVWLDDFAYGLSPWFTTTLGAGSAVNLVASHAFMGGYSAQLVCGAVASAYASLRKYLSPLADSQWGLEAAFTLDSNLNRFEIRLFHYTGSVVRQYGARYSWPTSVLEVLDSDNTWKTVATGVYLLDGDDAFQHIKLVVDAENQAYVRLLLNTQAIVLTSYAPYEEASAVYASLVCQLDSYSEGAAGSTNYVDGAIITQNEP